MNVNLTYLSSSLVEAERALESVVREHVGDGAIFKVGMSVHPIDRVFGVKPTFLTGGGPKKVGKMNRDYRWGVRTLYLLFEAMSHSQCQFAERQLIERLNALAPTGQVRNRRGGGGGPRGRAPYKYVYLART